MTSLFLVLKGNMFLSNQVMKVSSGEVQEIGKIGKFLRPH